MRSSVPAGDHLDYRGVEKWACWLSEKEIGKASGQHAFRYVLATTVVIGRRKGRRAHGSRLRDRITEKLGLEHRCSAPARD